MLSLLCVRFPRHQQTRLRSPPTTHTSAEVEADEHATPPTVCRAMSMPGFSVSCPIPTSATGKKRNDVSTISLKGAGFGTPPHSHECPGVHMAVPSARVHLQRE